MEKFKRYFLFLTVFLTGAVIMVLELLGTRIIAPYYGSTLYVWSSMITVTLVFLSIGYFLGGRLADRRPEFHLLYLLIFLVAIVIAVVPKVDSLILIATNPLGPRFGPLISSLILFFLPMSLLGMVTPYAIKLATGELRTLGVTAGKLYAIATMGSFGGTVLTGFYLIPHHSITAIIYSMTFLLFFISITWFLVGGRYRYSLVLIPIVFLPSHRMSLQEHKKIVYKSESIYGQIKVVDVRDKRSLLLDGSSQTTIDKGTSRSVFSCTRCMMASFLLRPEAKRVLLIGLAGGAIARELAMLPIEVDIVEIEPKMLEVAKRYFGFEENDAIHVFIQDGRYFIQQSNKRYELVMFDAFSGYSPPGHLLTVEMFEAIEKIMVPEGILIINTLGWTSGEGSRFQRAIYKTLREVFPQVFVVAKGSENVENVIFYAAREGLSQETFRRNVPEISFASQTPGSSFMSQVPGIEKMEVEEDTPILRDDFNPAEALSIPSAEALRELGRGGFGDEVLVE